MIWFCIKLRIAQGIVVWDSGIARYDIVVFYGSWFFLVWCGIVGCLVWYGIVGCLVWYDSKFVSGASYW